jgi:protein-tyrosine phosphatase
MSFAVLFVCTGNICRSPAAELLFRARVRPDANVTVSSAGTYGVVGHGVDQPTAMSLRDIGIDPDGHRARRLDAQLLQSADLILTASIDDRAIVLHAEPLLWQRTFTLREFVRIASSAGLAHSGSGVPTPDELRRRVVQIAQLRGSSAPVGAGENNVPDPYGASIAMARSTVSAISTLVDAALDELDLRAAKSTPSAP